MNRWILFILLFFAAVFLFLYIRKVYAIRKVRSMSIPEKLERINQITIPLGFEYKLSQDIFTSRSDAWQRDYGYCRLYDRHAALFHMVFDCEPIYFDYENTTWLIEFWKGQYGITSGCEIGIYKANHIVSEKERKHAFFHSVSDREMPVFSFTLLDNSLPVCRLCSKHWWLTGFCVGRYSNPENLSMKITVTFPNTEMCRAFSDGLTEAGYHCGDIYISENASALTFSVPHSVQPLLRRSCYSSWVQFKNRILVFLYYQITKPFCFTIDRLLLLYEYLPFLFRRIMKLKRIKKKRRKSYEH